MFNLGVRSVGEKKADLMVLFVSRALNQRAAAKYPLQYKVAVAKYPAPIDC